MTNTIQPQELRVGNLVLIDGVPKSVIEISIHGVCYVDDIKLFETYGNISPIPITEEILIKAGFEKSFGTNWEYERSIGAIKMYCLWNTEWYFELGGIYLGDHPKYLHQLQNIYYSLLGKELEIKL
ncbi:hypothetical protein ABDK00_014135 [Niabella insulamsoli]|uniref:hypothetical protein n=1 Tax=Niabella insulamsoli TaxID=3144874 RepID=UPI0031FCF758